MLTQLPVCELTLTVTYKLTRTLTYVLTLKLLEISFILKTRLSADVPGGHAARYYPAHWAMNLVERFLSLNA